MPLCSLCSLENSRFVEHALNHEKTALRSLAGEFTFFVEELAALEKHFLEAIKFNIRVSMGELDALTNALINVGANNLVSATYDRPPNAGKSREDYDAALARLYKNVQFPDEANNASDSRSDAQ